MSNVYKIPNREARLDAASRWVSRLDRGLSAEEKISLQQWLAEAQENRDVFLQMVAMWDKMEVLSDLADLFPRQTNSRTRWLPVAIAASLVIVGFAVWFGVATFRLSGSDHQLALSDVQGLYKTAIGEHSTLSLPDGTRVTLNTNTLLRVNYSEQNRLLLLERGEVHVNVAQDESRPLSVVTGGQIIQAVGTVFNVELHSDQTIELVVEEGRVLIGVQEPTFQSTQNTEPLVLPVTSTLIGQGQQLLLGATGKKELEPIQPAEIEVKLSWRHGNLMFRGESLEDAIEEISRYTRVEFVFLDEDLKNIRVAGLFKAGDVDGLLTTLRGNFNISYQQSDEKIFLGNR